MGSTSSQNESAGSIVYLRQELARRTYKPWKQVTFVFYFFSAIVLFGGFGIWVELVELNLLSENADSYDGLYRAIATFYPALIGSASFHLLLIATGTSNRIMTAFGATVLLFAFVIAILLAIFHHQYPIARFFVVILLASFSIWLWSIADADNPIYTDVPADTSSGGSLVRPLKGDTSEFKVD